MAPQRKRKDSDKEQEAQGLGKARAFLLAVLVLVVTGGAFVLLSNDEDPVEQPQAEADDAVVEVAPVVPTGKIVSASWRTDEQRRDDVAAAEEEAARESNSLLDQVEWSDGDSRREYEKSIERTVSEIHGLGIYVAPADETEEKK